MDLASFGWCFKGFGRFLLGGPKLLFFVQLCFYQLNAPVNDNCFGYAHLICTFLHKCEFIRCQSYFQSFSLFVIRWTACPWGHFITSLLPVHYL